MATKYDLVVKRSNVTLWPSFEHSYIICFLPSFKSVGLSVQEKERKIDLQDGGHCCHLGFPIRTILVIFDLQVTLMLSYQVSSQLAHGCRRSRLLKQLLLMPHDARRTKDNGH